MMGYYKGVTNKLSSVTSEDRENCLKLQQENESAQVNSVKHGSDFLTGPDYTEGHWRKKPHRELFTHTTHSP